MAGTSSHHRVVEMGMEMETEMEEDADMRSIECSRSDLNIMTVLNRVIIDHDHDLNLQFEGCPAYIVGVD